MAKEKKKKKEGGFWKEFKAFISRGNVLDMAVGIIIGGAFTAIITALVNNILTPLLQMIPGMDKDGFGALQVVLKPAQGESPAVVLDFGIVISAIISFLLTALMLFTIIKIVTRVNNAAKKAREEYEAKKAKEEAAEVVSEAVEEPAPAPVPPAPTTEELLAEIRDLLKAQGTDCSKKE
jgi:large conductance mechanosensitive channel